MRKRNRRYDACTRARAVPEKSTDLALDESLEAELATLRSELFEAELALLRSRAADLRAKLSTERLTQVHKNQIQDALRGLQLRRSVAVSASTGNGAAVEYAQGFTEVFTALGWDVEQLPESDALPSKGDCRASGFRTEDREPERVYLRYAEASATQSIAEGSRFAPGSHLRSGSLRLAVVSRPGDTTAAVLGSALRRLGIPVARFEDPNCAENHLELLIGKQPATSQSRPAAG
jgi:hypothetical protein